MTDFEKIETIFFKVLKDMEDYLGDLTLVGGWMPYIYSRFLWNNLMVKPVTTVDIDFGFGETKPRIHSKTIFEILSGLDYILKVKVNSIAIAGLFSIAKTMDLVPTTTSFFNVFSPVTGTVYLNSC